MDQWRLLEMKDNAVGIIIPTVNRRRNLSVALESVLRQTTLPSEIIIVDASDTNDTSDLVRDLARTHPLVPFKYIRIEANQRSSARQRNIGVKLSESPLLCFLDDDVELDASYLEEIVRIFKEDAQERIGGVGGNILDVMPAGGTLSFKVEQLFGLHSGPMKMTRLGQNTGIYTVEGRPFRAEWLPGGNCTIRREVFRSLSFEEAFATYSLYEDALFSYELSKRMQLWVQPAATMRHLRASEGRLHPGELVRMRIRNQYHLFKYSIEAKSTADYLRFFFFLIYLGVVPSGSFVKHGFKGLAREVFVGMLKGVVDIMIGRYPKRTTTFMGALPTDKTHPPSRNPVGSPGLQRCDQ
jgi:GT2 family glycosyltransferase